MHALDHYRNISGVAELVLALVWGKVIEALADPIPKIVDGAFGSFA